MKIDIHIHTKERSRCAKSSETEQICAAIEAGLNAVVFTDHGRLIPVEKLAYLNNEFAPFQIFGGIEINTVDGEDIIVLGVYDQFIEAHNKWTYADLYSYVREHDGFLAIAHPFRYHSDIRLCLKQFPPDAIEVYSCNTPLDASDQIIEIAELLDIPILSNSDAHTIQELGQYYNLLDYRPSDEKELICMLREGLFTAIMRTSTNTVKLRSKRRKTDRIC